MVDGGKRTAPLQPIDERGHIPFASVMMVLSLLGVHSFLGVHGVRLKACTFAECGTAEFFSTCCCSVLDVPYERTFCDQGLKTQG